MKWIVTLLAITLSFTTTQAFSRDTKYLYSIDDALTSKTYEGRLDPTIKLYFADQAHPKIRKNLGNFTTNKKTNSFNKTDIKACQWVLLSALLTLQERAKKEGANAVTNIISYYKKKPFSSQDQFECHAGSFVAGVALQADMAKIGK